FQFRLERRDFKFPQNLLPPNLDLADIAFPNLLVEEGVIDFQRLSNEELRGQESHRYRQQHQDQGRRSRAPRWAAGRAIGGDLVARGAGAVTGCRAILHGGIEGEWEAAITEARRPSREGNACSGVTFP